MTNKIESFEGDHAFLSNFFPRKMTFQGEEFPTSEHAFQACKAIGGEDRRRIREAETPQKAKQIGKRVRLRPGWDGSRIRFMDKVLKAKFQDPELRERLLATGDAELVEGNTWNDTFWGVCRGKGRNELGKALMRLRDEIRRA